MNDQNLERLRQELERLDPAPRETARVIWNAPFDATDPGSNGFKMQADYYWKDIRARKEPPPSALQREIRSLENYARKLADGLGNLPITDEPPRPVGDFDPGRWAPVSFTKEDGYQTGCSLVCWSELGKLANFLDQWASSLKVAGNGPRNPPPPRIADWTPESGLALNIALLCVYNNRPLAHALPITKSVLAWATEKGGRPRPLGSKTWKIVKSQVMETMDCVAKRQRNGATE